MAIAQVRVINERGRSAKPLPLAPSVDFSDPVRGSSPPRPWPSPPRSVASTARGRGRARLVDERAVVIGAGPAGLAAAWPIGHAGLDPLVVEQADAVAASWWSRHDQLRLNTHRVFSHQPGARIPRRYGPFPARDDYGAYLERYAAGMRIRFGTAAGRIDRAGPGWKLSLGAGSISTANVVVATGPSSSLLRPGLWFFGLDSSMHVHRRQARQLAGMIARPEPYPSSQQRRSRAPYPARTATPASSHES
jgi:hypothetical protein